MIERDYVSPDGALRFLVRADRDEITVGFEGFPWHTHGDILAALSSGTPEQATEQFIADLITNKLIIALSKVSGVVRNVWISEDPIDDLGLCQPGETVEFRLWDGAAVAPASFSKDSCNE